MLVSIKRVGWWASIARRSPLVSVPRCPQTRCSWRGGLWRGASDEVLLASLMRPSYRLMEVTADSGSQAATINYRPRQGVVGTQPNRGRQYLSLPPNHTLCGHKDTSGGRLFGTPFRLYFGGDPQQWGRQVQVVRDRFALAGSRSVFRCVWPWQTCTLIKVASLHLITGQMITAAELEAGRMTRNWHFQRITGYRLRGFLLFRYYSVAILKILQCGNVKYIAVWQCSRYCSVAMLKILQQANVNDIAVWQC